MRYHKKPEANGDKVTFPDRRGGEIGIDASHVVQTENHGRLLSSGDICQM